MPWFSVDDGFADHPKVIALRSQKRGEQALSLWLLAGSWCAKHLTDGRVPAGTVKHLGFQAADAEALCGVQLWERVDSGYQFHEWSACNPTKAEVEAKREKNRTKLAKWRETHPPVPASNRGCNPVTNQASNPAPLLSSPLPSEEKREERGEPACAPVRDLPVPAPVPVAPVATEPPTPRFKPLPEETHAPEPELWLRLHRCWGQVVHRGLPFASPHATEREFRSLAEACAARRPADPEGIFAEVLTRYVARKRERGGDIKPRYFADDFASLADHGSGPKGKPVKPPIVLELERAKQAHAAAKAAGNRTEEQRLAHELGRIGRRMTGNG